MTAVATDTVRLGTRASALALVQARLVAAALESTGVAVELRTITTEGDRRAPDTPWGEGAFVGAIEAALLAGEIDLAVHSAKDVPTQEDPRLRIAAFLPREAPEDVLVAPGDRPIGRLEDLPAGARVGTDSPRRTAFLRSIRPDLRMHPLHGNVDTRLRRLDAGETDALVLAAAGLRRLGRADRISFAFPPELVPPAPGQGALAVQVRADDERTLGLVRRSDDAPTRLALTLERTLLAEAGGGCRAPLGALARGDGQGGMTLRAGYATPDGRVTAHADGRLDDAAPAARMRLVSDVLGELARTAAAALAAAEPRAPVAVVTRPAGSAAGTALALVDRGIVPCLVPTIRRTPMEPSAVAALVGSIEPGDWVVATSAYAVEVLLDGAHAIGVDLAAGSRGVRWAAVGPATARALELAGIRTAFRPDRETGAALAATLPIDAGASVVLPAGDLADRALAEGLSARGARVRQATIYRTAAGEGTADALAAALERRPVAVTLASPSAAQGLVRLADALGASARAAVRAIPVVEIGPTTSDRASELGLSVAATARQTGPAATADAVAALIRPEESR